jgi:hypothetical protein
MFSLITVVNVPTVRNKQEKTSVKNVLFVGILKATAKKRRIREELFQRK